MICAVGQRQFSDLSRSIDAAVIERRLPYMGCLELTYRCNQACRHCYCNLGAEDSSRRKEMPFAEIDRLLGEAADAGCLWLLLTGGEVLLREDFWDIYLSAVRRGLLVEVFTNAALIDEKAAARFAEFPPLGLDISIYGSSPQLHDAVTQRDGSFSRTLAGIDWLRTYKVPFALKTVLMTLNCNDLAGMKALAARLGVKFRYDALVCPRTDGGKGPVQYRLDAERMARLDLEEDYQSCARLFDGFWNKKPDEALTCGGGVFAFNINPYGVLSPCTMFRSFQYPLKGRKFLAAWQEMAADHEARKGELSAPACSSCSMVLLCSNCPAWSEIEAGSLQSTVEYVCAYAKCLEKKYFAKKEESGNGKETLRKTAA
jgi:MoaA/NifB/PqqE/SkfB family radical SAM enzyme